MTALANAPSRSRRPTQWPKKPWTAGSGTLLIAQDPGPTLGRSYLDLGKTVWPSGRKFGGTRRHALLLGLLGAMAIAACQGYLQAALIGVSPAFLFFVFDGSFRLRPVWREYLLVIG